MGYIQTLNDGEVAGTQTPTAATTTAATTKVATKAEVDAAAKNATKTTRTFDALVAAGVVGAIFAYNKFAKKKGRK